jgi:hypothetical protein
MNTFRLFQLVGVAPWCFAATYIPVSELMWLGPLTFLGFIGLVTLVASALTVVALAPYAAAHVSYSWREIEAWYARERERCN